MHAGNKYAVTTHEIRIRDDEVRRLREKLYEIRELSCNPFARYPDKDTRYILEDVAKIADDELWPG